MQIPSICWLSSTSFVHFKLYFIHRIPSMALNDHRTCDFWFKMFLCSYGTTGSTELHNMCIASPGTAWNIIAPHSSATKSLILMISCCLMSETNASFHSFILTEVTPGDLNYHIGISMFFYGSTVVPVWFFRHSAFAITNNHVDIFAKKCNVYIQILLSAGLSPG